MNLKESSFKNLLKQWNKMRKLNLFEKMWGKIMINILHSLLLPLTIGGGKKAKLKLLITKFICKTFVRI
jgi:hypothetical protein